MRFFNNLSIKARSILAFSIMLLFFISYAIYVLLAMTDLERTTEKMYYESYQMSTSIIQAKVNFLEIENQLAKSLLIQDEYAINTIQDTIREHSHDFLIKLNEVNEKIDNPRYKPLKTKLDSPSRIGKKSGMK